MSESGKYNNRNAVPKIEEIKLQEEASLESLQNFQFVESDVVLREKRPKTPVYERMQKLNLPESANTKQVASDFDEEATEEDLQNHKVQQLIKAKELHDNGIITPEWEKYYRKHQSEINQLNFTEASDLEKVG